MRNDLRRCVEDAIESLIILLDTIDGDPDLEAQCDDEGFDSDSEPDRFTEVPIYQGEIDGSGSQMVIVQNWGGVHPV
jgi:hypothetical protein